MKENNYVDGFVHDKLHKLRVLPSGDCTDEDFLRRTYIDVVGLLPTVEEYRVYSADKDPNKRAKVVDQLLERKEFTEM